MSSDSVAEGTGWAARLVAGLRWLLVGTAAALILLLFGVALMRLGYPYHLEWMEGGSVDHLRWLLGGHPLYVEPSMEFVPYGYPPLYYYLATALAWIMGAGFVPLRLLSIAATCGSLWLIYRLVSREGESRLSGFLAAAAFAACYPLAGFWFDVGRVDSLFLCLLLASVYLARFGEGRKTAIAAGVLLVLACLTKQTAMIVAPALVLAAAVLRPIRWTAWFAGTALGGLAVATVSLDLWHDGWYKYYIFELPRRHVFMELGPLEFLWRDLATDLPIALILGGVYVALALRRPGRRAVVFHALVALGLLIAGYLVRRTAGGFLNVLLPALAATAILFGLGAQEVVRLSQRLGPAGRKSAEALLYSVCLLQMALLLYDPRPQVPGSEDRAAGDRLVAQFAEYDQILVPEFGYLAAKSGKGPVAPWMAWFAVLRVEDPEFPKNSLGEMREALLARRFDAVVFADRIWLGVLAAELDGYEHEPIEYSGADVFMPLTGFRTRPVVISRPGPSGPENSPIEQ